MNRMLQRLLIAMLVCTLFSCASQQSGEDEDFASPEATAEADAPSSETATEQAEAAPQEAPAEQSQQQEQAKNEDELLLDENNENQQQAQQEPQQQPQEQVQEQPQQQPEQQVQQQPDTLQPEPVQQAVSMVEIKNIQYKGNETGGTLVIDATGPFTYTTRSNPELKQYIIEIPNSILPQKLKRPLNTKDFKGSVGSIDAYQNAGSNVSRFVLQMREGAQEPVLQQEGNSLLVATNDVKMSSQAQAELPPDSLPKGPPSMQAAPPANEKEATLRQQGLASGTGATQEDRALITNLNLEDFMAGNKKFYGREVTCDFDDVQTREAIEFVMLDSGLNLILDDLKDIGTVNLRLREVPWDQCLVLIMKVKKLGYTRMGNVLRISKLEDIAKEEDDAIKRAEARKKIEPAKVKIFPVSYAQAKDLEPQVKSFLSKDRGAVTSDARTNSLIVTSTDEDLNKIEKMLKNLDTPPPQVLIEGKIVEASDSFQKSMGINWGFTGQDIKIMNNKAGSPVNMRPSFAFGTQSSANSFGLTIGTLDILGDLSATLSIFELENKVKVLSSPRIVTMNNEAAQISQSTSQPQATITTTGTTTQKSYTSVPVTLSLNVTPQVTNDASIIMKVNVKREFIGAPVDPIEATSTPKFSRNAETKVIVKNGQTTVIGGIYQNDISEGSSGLSGLKDIPILGYLFKGQSSRKEKNELLIFLTPRIVSVPSSETDSASAAATVQEI